MLVWDGVVVSGNGFTAFGRQFSERVSLWKDELQTLEAEGVTYEQFVFDDEDGGPGLYRVRFAPRDIYRHVAGLVSWDEYLRGGLDAVSDRHVAAEAEEIHAWRLENDTGIEGFCAADFLGAEVENLVCGGRHDRYERVRPSDAPHDAIAIVHQIASGFPVAIKALADRGENRASFAISDERDFQDILYVVLRSIFDDVMREEPTPSHAGSSKRTDFTVPSAGLFIETKAARNAQHGKNVADELKVDIESYHTHPSCSTLIALVWDPGRHVPDPNQVERDLTGKRTKSGRSFDVAVHVIT